MGKKKCTASAVLVPLVLMIVLLGKSSVVQAQLRWQKIEAGVFAGTMLYQGDLSPHAWGAWQKLRVNRGIFLQYPLNNFFAIRGQYSVARVNADESVYEKPSWRQQRNFAMSTRLAEWSVMGIYYFNGQLKQQAVSRFTPYVMAGIATVRTAVTRDYSRFNSEAFSNTSHVTTGLNSDLATALPTRIMAMPVGAGLKYGLSTRWSVTAELQYRFTRNDLLDGFSQSGDPQKKDHYYGVTLGIVYRLGQVDELPCPAWMKKRR
jgi:opacity protein-like surface antigen